LGIRCAESGLQRWLSNTAWRRNGHFPTHFGPAVPISHSVQKARNSTRNNVSVFLSSWDASLPPQGSPSAATFPAPPPVAVRVALAAVAGGGVRRITRASVVRIDEAHGNTRAEYLKMNTTWPSAAQLAELKRASVVTAEALTVMGDEKSVELMMPANAAYTVLLELA
jgi:hypothetical protein